MWAGIGWRPNSFGETAAPAAAVSQRPAPAARRSFAPGRGRNYRWRQGTRKKEWVLHIREMSRRHIKQVAQIEQACFSQPWSEKSLEAELDNPNAIFLVAEEDHIVAGYMGMHTVLDEGYIANIAISQQFRRRGTATLLTKRMMEYAREKQLSFLTLEVRQSNEAAISLYRKMG